MVSLKGTRITWLGHATVLVQTAKGTNILIDPFIENNPKYPKGFKFPEKINYILLTHGHGDHVADVARVHQKTGATVLGMIELMSWLTQNGVAEDKVIS